MNAIDPIVATLTQIGPILAGELAKRLVEQGNAKNEPHARQMILRARSDKKILSSDPITFNKSFLCYLPAHSGKQLSKAIKKQLEHRPPLKRIFYITKANKGFITESQIAKGACCPESVENNSTKRLTIEKTIDQALSLKIIERVFGKEKLYRIGPDFGQPDIGSNAFTKQLELEDILIESISEWLQHVYLLPPEARQIRNTYEEAVVFNQNWFDIQGPVYVGSRPVVEQPSRDCHKGFLVADLLSYREAGIDDAESFIDRVSDIRRRWKALSITPIFVAAGFTIDAWEQLRKHRCAAVTTSDVLGKSLQQLLRKFKDTLASKSNDELNVDKISDLLEYSSNIDVNEGILANLKGAIFELIVAHYYRSLGFDITLQKTVRTNSPPESFEVDVVAIKGPLAVLVECKGRKKTVTEDPKEISRHFVSRFNAAADSFGWNIEKLYQRVDVVFITLGIIPEGYVSTPNTLKATGVNRIIYDRSLFIQKLVEASQDQFKKLIDRFF